MLTRSSMTGATAAVPLAVADAAGEVGGLQVEAGALGVFVGQCNHRGAGVDHHVEGAAVDLGAGVVVAVGAGRGSSSRAAVARRARGSTASVAVLSFGRCGQIA